MIRLCIDARMIRSSGIGTYLRNIIKDLNRELFDISLIINPSKENLNDYSSYKLIPCFASIYSIKEQIVLPFKIPSCDIFWSPHFNIPVFPIRARKRIVTIHDLYHMKYYNTLSWKEKIYAKVMLSLATKKADKIITDSNFSKSELIKYFPFSKEKAEVIYLGIDKSIFNNNAKKEKIDLVKEKYGLFSKYFIFVGNLKKHKNISGLLQAFIVVSKKAKEKISLVIVGKKEGLRNFHDVTLEGEVSSYKKNIYFLTDITDEELSILYSQAVALVFPSFYEGFGFPPIEAMSCKTATIVSQAASIPEVCGDATYYVDPNSYLDIAEGMLIFLNDNEERKKYIKLGEEQKENFSWEKTAKMYEETFIKLG